MQLPPKNYDAMVKRANPPSPVVKDCLWAFFVGGAICLLGEALRQFYLSWYDKDLAGTLTSHHTGDAFRHHYGAGLVPKAGRQGRGPGRWYLLPGLPISGQPGGGVQGRRLDNGRWR